MKHNAELINTEPLINEFTKLGYTLYLGTSLKNGKPTAKCTKPSKSRLGIKYLFNFYFSNDERRAQYLTDFLLKEMQHNNRKADEKTKKKEYTANLKASEHYAINDIIVNSWGWEQTNIDFYKVIEVLPKSLKVIKIGNSVVPGSEYPHGMACSVIPSPENEKGEPFILRLKADSTGNIWICNPEKHYYFHKWNGVPEYMSWYA